MDIFEAASMKLLTLLLAVCLFLASIGTSVAACGLGKTPTYKDITAVRYARTGCFGTCPDYEVLMSPDGLYYVGRTYTKLQGTYNAHLGNDLVLAKRLLRAHSFFQLSYDAGSVLVTDSAHFIIAVERCGVTTILDYPYYPSRRDRPDLSSLFDGLDAIVKSTKWQKTSDSTASVPETWAQIP